MEKTKAVTSKSGIIQSIVLNGEYSAAMAAAFSNLQTIVLNSIDSMSRLSPQSTVDFLNSLETVKKDVQEYSDKYAPAIKESIEAIDLDIMSDEDFEKFQKEKETTALAQQQEQQNTQNTQNSSNAIWE